MRLKRLFLSFGVGVLVLLLGSFIISAKNSSGPNFVKPETCFECHVEVQELWSEGKHKKTLNCVKCHDNLNEHIASPEEKKPVTNLNPEIIIKTRATIPAKSKSQKTMLPIIIGTQSSVATSLAPPTKQPLPLS